MRILLSIYFSMNTRPFRVDTLPFSVLRVSVSREICLENGIFGSCVEDQLQSSISSIFL